MRSRLCHHRQDYSLWEYLDPVTKTNDLVDNRPKCTTNDASNSITSNSTNGTSSNTTHISSSKAILCRANNLNCSTITIYIVKICITIALILPLSIMMRLLLTWAHRLNKSTGFRKFQLCICCCFGKCLTPRVLVFFIVLGVTVSFTVVGIYCLDLALNQFHIDIGSILIQFAISYALKKLLDLPLWGVVYFACCCKHRTRMEKRIENMKSQEKYTFRRSRRRSSQPDEGFIDVSGVVEM